MFLPLSGKHVGAGGKGFAVRVCAALDSSSFAIPLETGGCFRPIDQAILPSLYCQFLANLSSADQHIVVVEVMDSE